MVPNGWEAERLRQPQYHQQSQAAPCEPKTQRIRALVSSVRLNEAQNPETAQSPTLSVPVVRVGAHD